MLRFASGSSYQIPVATGHSQANWRLVAGADPCPEICQCMHLWDAPIPLPHAKFQLRISKQDRPHVIALMETKLNDAICDTELDNPGYDLYRQDRTRNGGGVYWDLNYVY